MEIPPSRLIARKRDGLALTRDEIFDFIEGVTSGRWTDAQVGAMLMAIYLRDMDADEMAALTQAMVASGEHLALDDVAPPRIDKHSTGGVGDKVSLVFAPLAASLGIRVPMLSGRSLGHTGGTLDKLESIPGLETSLSHEHFSRVLNKTGMAIAGAASGLVPADRRLYALRDATATVGHLPLIASSIMSKKLAVSAEGLILDVKTGSGAFLGDQENALRLCRTMVEMGRAAGRPVTGFITRMEQPLGMRIGNALEVRETIDALQGRGPADLMEVTLNLGVAAMRMAGMGNDDASRLRRLKDAIASGKAMETFLHWVTEQGGDHRCCDDPRLLPLAPRSASWTAPRTGYISTLDARRIGLAVHASGAGRNRPGEPVDPGAGLVLHYKAGDSVQEGEILATVYAGDSNRLDEAMRLLQPALEITDVPPGKTPVVLYRVDSRGVRAL